MYKDWFIYWDENHKTFEWFIVQYFGQAVMDELNQFRIEEKGANMFSRLDAIWYELPDNRFNIIENPKGWHEFLMLIEWEFNYEN